MKNKLRKENKEKRSLMTKNEVCLKSRSASERLLSMDVYCNAKTIMLYMPLGNETETSCIMKKAFEDGKRVVLPVTDENNVDIIPCIVTLETEFKKGAYSISEPSSMHICNESEIDLVAVPGIAFGRNGARVGFGKGYYDRFLKRTKAVKIGFCYDFQLSEYVAADDHDVPMDYIVTDTETLKLL